MQEGEYNKYVMSFYYEVVIFFREQRIGNVKNQFFLNNDCILVVKLFLWFIRNQLKGIKLIFLWFSVVKGYIVIVNDIFSF